MKKTTRQNLIFLACVLAAAAALLAWRQAGRGGAGTAALLQYGEGEQRQELRLPLDRDGDYEIDTGRCTIHLRVRDGGVAFVDSPCPDHLCEGFGTLRRAGDWAACLPARASLTIVEE